MLSISVVTPQRVGDKVGYKDDWSPAMCLSLVALTIESGLKRADRVRVNSALKHSGQLPACYLVGRRRQSSKIK